MKRFNSYLIILMAMFALTGTVAAKDPSPESIAGATSIDAAKAKDLFDIGTLFVDVRSDKDWAAGRIPDAVHFELKKVFSEETLAKEAKKSDAVVIYCNGHSCHRSAKACTKAVAWGYSNVYYFRDGFPAWKAAGYPVE